MIINLNIGGFMNIKKIQTMDMHIQKIIFYSTYVDCLSRLIQELIENGNSNLKPNDLPNLTALLSKFSLRLKVCCSKMERDWEFL